MRGLLLLALPACLITNEGPVIETTGKIIAMDADDQGIVWADRMPSAPTEVWVLEAGVIRYHLGTFDAIDRLAVVRHHAYVSNGEDQQIVGADDKFIVVRGGYWMQAYDPRLTEPDRASWTHTYVITRSECAAVARGWIAVGGENVVRTFELGTGREDAYDVGAHSPMVVRPTADGVVFADATGVFAATHAGVEQLADA